MPMNINWMPHLMRRRVVIVAVSVMAIITFLAVMAIMGIWPLRDRFGFDDGGVELTRPWEDEGLARIEASLRDISVNEAKIQRLLARNEIERIRFIRCSIKPAVIGQLVALPRLESLEFTDSCDDAILAEVSQLTRLEKLVVAKSARVTDAGMAHLAKLRKLKHLVLEDVCVSDDGLKEIGGLDQLQYLSLGSQGIAQTEQDVRCGISDAGLLSVRRLRSLRILFLTSTSVTDAGLAHLVDLQNIERLGLDGTRVSDGGLQSLSELRSLRTLDVRHTRITTHGTEQLVRTAASRGQTLEIDCGN